MRLTGLARTFSGSLRARAQHAKNAGWSVVEYLFFPFMAIVTTPFFLSVLGQEEFGLGALITAITSLSGPANLGMAAVTVKFVSSLRGAGDYQGSVQVVRKTLALACAAGLSVSLVVVLFADMLATSLFSGMGDHGRVALALQIGAVTLAISQAEMVFSSAIKGCERYDITARLEIAMRLASMAIALLLAWIWKSVIVMLLAGVFLSLINCAIKAAIASRIVGGPVWKMSLRVPVKGALLSFAGWSWLQTNAGAVFQIFDRILVGSALGAAPIAAYTVTTQLGSQVHAVPAAAMAFLFPTLSRKLGAGQHESARRVEAIGVLLTMGMVIGLGAFFSLFRVQILTLWLGAEFASQYSELFLWIVLAYTILGLGIAPHFLLLGRGDVKFLSLLGMAGGALSLVGMLVLVGPFGLLGIVWARALYGIVTLLSVVRLAYLRARPERSIAPIAP